MSLGTTDLFTLEPIFRAAIIGITPTHQRARDSGWQPKPGDELGAVGHKTRLFRFVWAPGGFVEDGLFGAAADGTGGGVHEVESILSIIVDYPEGAEFVAEMVDDDQYDLASTLEDLKAPTNDGLVFVEPFGDPFDIAPENEGDQAQYQFDFNVRYMKARP